MRQCVSGDGFLHETVEAHTPGLDDVAFSIPPRSPRSGARGDVADSLADAAQTQGRPSPALSGHTGRHRVGCGRPSPSLRAHRRRAPRGTRTPQVGAASPRADRVIIDHENRAWADGGGGHSKGYFPLDSKTDPCEPSAQCVRSCSARGKHGGESVLCDRVADGLATGTAVERRSRRHYIARSGRSLRMIKAPITVPSRRVHRTHRVARSQRNGPDDLLRGSGCSLSGQPRRVVGFAGGPKQALARLCPCEPVTLHGRRLAAQHERPTSEVQRLSELQDHGSAVLDRFPAGRTSGIIGEGVGGQSRGGQGGGYRRTMLKARG